MTRLQAPYRGYLTRQFTIAYNLYLSILSEVDSCVKEALGRQDGGWCLRHNCPACTYTLKGERALLFSLLWGMDGNDSLKRVLRQYPSAGDKTNQAGPISEHTDTRTVPAGLYLSRDYVDKWARELVGSAKALSVDVSIAAPCS